jgi:hypothetical protein
MHPFREIINYSRCWKNGYLLASRRTSGTRSPNVAAFKVRQRIVFHATYRRPHGQSYFRELVFSDAFPGSFGLLLNLQVVRFLLGLEIRTKN